MIRILELFAGIGACSKALERLGVEHEIVDAVEIDKYAICSFNAIHGKKFEVQDITKWDKDLEVDLIMQGSPCQDFSVAGKQAGGDIGSGTRSSLMYETIRIVGKIRPKYVIWENVKNLLSKKHKHNFDVYIETMNILGYNSYYKVLNAKEYGIPQNRERVFTISIRKDIDDGSFKFPEKEPLKLRLKDMLEEEVDKKYYLSDVQIDKIKASNFMQEKKRIQEKDYSDTILARDWKDPKCVQVGNLEGGNTEPKILEDFYKNRPVREYEEVAPTLRSERQGLKVVEPHEKILIKNGTKQGYMEAEEGDSINISFPTSNTRRGRVGKQVAQTLQCNDLMAVVEPEIRIRKLTPKECWRLMGFDDEDFKKAKKALNETFYKGKDRSSSQLYKQAGNSIVVNVLEKILKGLIN